MRIKERIRRILGFRTARDYLAGTALYAVVYLALNRIAGGQLRWELLTVYVAYSFLYTLIASWKLVSGSWTPARWARTTLAFCVPISVFVGYTAAFLPQFFLLFGMFIIGIGLPMIGQMRPTLWIITAATYAVTYHAFVAWMKPDYFAQNLESAVLSPVVYSAIVYWLAKISSFIEGASDRLTRTLISTRKQKRELDRVTQELKIKDKNLAKDLNFARSFQLNQLPDIGRFNANGFKSAMHYIALDTVGGDIIDMVEIAPDRIGVFVGDVSGHGVRAAMVAMMARVGFANLYKISDDPGIVTAALNGFLCRSLENDKSCYMTAIYAIIDRQKMEISIVCAGHQPGILVRANGTIEEIETHPSLFLGIEQDMAYQTTVVKIERGDQLLLYTDGLTEPLNDAGEQYGEKAFGEFLKGRTALEPAELLAGLAVSLEAFSTESLRDDVAIVCVRVE